MKNARRIPWRFTFTVTSRVSVALSCTVAATSPAVAGGRVGVIQVAATGAHGRRTGPEPPPGVHSPRLLAVLALVFDGPGRIRHVTDHPDPVVQDPGDAVVRVLAAGLCGSDLHPYEGREPCRAGTVPGHEVVGVVTAVGADVSRVAVGDRVVVPFSTSCGTCAACGRGLSSRCERGQLFGWGDPDPAGWVLDGGQAGLVRVPLADGSLVGLPEAIGDLAGLLLADNLPTGWYAARRGGVEPGSRVAVVGLGAVGLCAIAAARAMGAAEVIALDPVPSRRDGATQMGAQAIDPADAPPDLGCDVAIDAAGPAAAQLLAARAVRPGGAVSIIAVQTDAAFAIDPVTAYDRNLQITAGRAPVRALLDDLLPLVAAGELAVPVDAVLTHPDRPLAEGPDLYRRFAAREPGLVKASFRP